MKTKIIKGLKIFIILLIVVLIGLVGYLKFALPNTGSIQNITVEATPERIARGEYLANHVRTKKKNISLYTNILNRIGK